MATQAGSTSSLPRASTRGMSQDGAGPGTGGVPLGGPGTMEGYLDKKGGGVGGVFGAARKYYCRLVDCKLSYFNKDDKNQTESGAIDISQLQSVKAGKGSSLELVSRSKSHTFTASNSTERDKWVSAIQESMLVATRRPSLRQSTAAQSFESFDENDADNADTVFPDAPSSPVATPKPMATPNHPSSSSFKESIPLPGINNKPPAVQKQEAIYEDAEAVRIPAVTTSQKAVVAAPRIRTAPQAPVNVPCAYEEVIIDSPPSIAEQFEYYDEVVPVTQEYKDATMRAAVLAAVTSSPPPPPVQFADPSEGVYEEACAVVIPAVQHSTENTQIPKPSPREHRPSNSESENTDSPIYEEACAVKSFTKVNSLSRNEPPQAVEQSGASSNGGMDMDDGYANRYDLQKALDEERAEAEAAARAEVNNNSSFHSASRQGEEEPVYSVPVYPPHQISIETNPPHASVSSITSHSLNSTSSDAPIKPARRSTPRVSTAEDQPMAAGVKLQESENKIITLTASKPPSPPILSKKPSPPSPLSPKPVIAPKLPHGSAVTTPSMGASASVVTVNKSPNAGLHKPAPATSHGSLRATPAQIVVAPPPVPDHEPPPPPAATSDRLSQAKHAPIAPAYNNGLCINGKESAGGSVAWRNRGKITVALKEEKPSVPDIFIIDASDFRPTESSVLELPKRSIEAKASFEELRAFLAKIDSESGSASNGAEKQDESEEPHHPSEAVVALRQFLSSD